MGFPTRKQRQAIEREGTNVLVSAGAGSGKTAVLTERVYRKLRDGVDIDRLIILTFTNKAAAEMKHRIRERIAKGDVSLSDALEKLDAAHIRTFDSFALHLLRQYGYYKNISPSLEIADEASVRLNKRRLIDDIFEARYARGDEAFLEYVGYYVEYDDRALKEQLIYFDTQLNLHADEEAFERFLRDELFTRGHFEKLFAEYESYILDPLNILDEKKEALHNLDVGVMTREFIRTFTDALKPVVESEDYESLKAALETMDLPTLHKLFSAVKDTPEEADKDIVREQRDNIKDFLDKLKERVKHSKEAHFEAFMSTRFHAGTIMDLLRTFREEYKALEMQEERFDYASIPRLVLEILDENPGILDEVTGHIDEVMVDEYQDTNHLQEQFLRRLTKDNLYMVGDIKQSIYRFRHADPSIFARKYRRYKRGGDGVVIDMNENFRSRREVIDRINTLFQRVMDSRIGGIEYDEDQALITGNSAYEATEDKASSYGFDLLVYDEQAETEILSRYDRRLVEAFLIAHEIKRRVDKGEKVFDEGRLRPIDYGDFAILAETSIAYPTFIDVFEHVGVPLTVHKNPSLIEHDEIKVFRNLLALVVSIREEDFTSPRFRHAFMSVGRSFLYGFEDDALFAQLSRFETMRSDTSEALTSTLRPPFDAFFERIFAVADAFRSLDDTVFDLLDATDFYKRLIRLRRTDDAKMRMDYILKLLEEKAAEGMGLGAFYEYLTTLYEEGEDKEVFIETAFDDDKVHLLTMHKSKGLEFPFVIIPHLFKAFRTSSMRNYEFDRHMGFILEYENEGLDQHFLFPLKRDREKDAELSERLRLLYVALSRAREGVIIPFGLSDEVRAEDVSHVPLFDKRRYRSFASVFASVFPAFSMDARRVGLSGLDITDDFTRGRASLESDADVKRYKDAPDAAEFKKRRRLSKAGGLFTAEDYEALDTGEYYHALFESIDFTVDAETALRNLDVEEAAHGKIAAFLRNPLIASLDIRQAYKEYPFVMDEDGVKTSGYIDLLLETPDAFIIIDYKLQNIEEEAYKEQIEGYASALSSMTSKPVHGYLYSIEEEKFLRIL